MEKLKHILPSIEYKDALIDYIEEHERCNSHLNGTGGIKEYKNDIEGWIKKVHEDMTIEPTETKVPGITYLLIRENDNKIIGMINIRPILNKALEYLGGNIGYGIRPSERRKGYNKINLYLGIKKCYEAGLDVILLDCLKDNIASSRTMIALGGKLIKEYYDDTKYHAVIEKYAINTKKSLEKYKNTYEKHISK